jgi:hypothetical protein
MFAILPGSGKGEHGLPLFPNYTKIEPFSAQKCTSTIPIAPYIITSLCEYLLDFFPRWKEHSVTYDQSNGRKATAALNIKPDFYRSKSLKVINSEFRISLLWICNPKGD